MHLFGFIFHSFTYFNKGLHNFAYFAYFLIPYHVLNYFAYFSWFCLFQKYIFKHIFPYFYNMLHAFTFSCKHLNNFAYLYRNFTTFHTLTDILILFILFHNLVYFSTLWNILIFVLHILRFFFFKDLSLSCICFTQPNILFFFNFTYLV